MTHGRRQRITLAWDDLPLRGKGLTVIAIPLVALILATLAYVLIQRQEVATARRVAHSLEVRAAIQRTTTLLIDAQSGVRGYRLTDRAEFLVPYEQARAALPDSLAHLAAVSRDNPGQVASALRVEALAVLQRDALEALRTDTQPRDSTLLAGQASMDALRAELAAMQVEEDRLLVAQAARAAVARTWGLVAIAVCLLGGVLGGVLATLQFTASVARRVRHLAIDAERLAAGQQLAAAAERLAADEVGLLARRLADAAALLAAREHQQLREANQQLEQRVRSRTAELSAQTEELAVQAADLATTNRVLAQQHDENEMFVYSVSHDLRGPLVNLQGFNQELVLVGKELRALLEADDVPPATRRRGLALLDEDMADALRFIQAGVARLSTIIDALLRLSRAGRVVYQRRPIDLDPLVARVVDSLRETLAARGASVAVAPLPATWGDAAALEQVFANLIGNAIAYLDPRRPGRIEVGSLPTVPIGADGGAPIGHAYFVRDNGLGIPAHAQEKIFQAFQRLHPEAGPGEGLGLALVRRVVERHGGAIRVESIQGAGSTFFVELPGLSAEGAHDAAA